MNHKQKFIYTALGAVIMLLGIGVGSIVSPPLIAQRNAVFDEITCRSLKVVNENDKRCIWLWAIDDNSFVSISNAVGKGEITFTAAKDGSNGITLKDDAGNKAIQLDSGGPADFANSVKIFDNTGKKAIELHSTIGINGIFISDKSDKTAISLTTQTPFSKINSIRVRDPVNKESFQVNAYPDRNELIVRDKSLGKGIGFYSDANEARQIRWNPPKE